MSTPHERNLKDADKIVSVALAQAGANTAGIDLEQVTGGQIENIAVELAIPAVPGITEAKALTFALQDSDDGTNFTAVDPAVTTTVTGPASGGTPAKTVRFRLHPGTRRYIRIAQTATATAGTFTGSMTLSLLF